MSKGEQRGAIAGIGGLQSRDVALTCFAGIDQAVVAPDETGLVSPFGEKIGHHARTFKPCFCTTASNLRAMPLGCFAPVSHFWTVDSLVFK